MHWLISEHEWLGHNKAIKVLNKLQLDITQFQDDKMQFKIAWKSIILLIFYSVDEFFSISVMLVCPSYC